MTPQKWLLLLATEARELTARQRQQIVAQTRRTEQVIGRKFRNAMRKFFVGQARRVIKGWMDSGGYLSAHAAGEYKDPASQLLGVNEDTAIVAASRPYVLEMTVAAINAASDLVGAPRVVAAKALKEPDILGIDRMVLWLAEQSAQRVVQVNDATRRGVQRTIVKGAAAGYSDYEIAYGSTRTRKDGFRPLKGMVERLYHGRPECIARTELAYSNNGASLHRYSQWGQDMVEVSDGPGCALTHHVQGLRPGESSSDDINGQKIAVKEANNWQVAHPNCRRVFLPLRQVRKPTTPPMEREAFITRPLTAAQRARVARDMARTRVTAPPKPPAPQVIEEAVPTPTATVYERAAEIRANESMTTLDDALALGKELEEDWRKQYISLREASEQAQDAAMAAVTKTGQAVQRARDKYKEYLLNEARRDILGDPMIAGDVRAARLSKAVDVAVDKRNVAVQALHRLEADNLGAAYKASMAVLQRTREMGRGGGAQGKARTIEIRGRPTKANRVDVEWAQDQIPRDWLDDMAERKGMRLVTDPEHRGYYASADDTMALPGKTFTTAHNRSTAVHEVIHRVQNADTATSRRINTIINDYYRKRTTGASGVQNPVQQLPKEYKPHEMFRQGTPEWPDIYMGKQYDEFNSSEILTMGVQDLLGGAARSRKDVIVEDKEIMQLMFGILAGI